MGLVVGALLAIQTAQQQFGGDVFAHLAALRELSEHPLNPSNPFVRSPDPTYHFNPYLVAVALVARVTGASPVSALSLGGFVNLGLLLIGIWSFARAFGSHRWTPHLLLFFSLVAWGFESWRWSGFWSLHSIGFALGYPSTFACGLSLLALAALARYFSTPSRWTIVGIGIATAVIATNHPFTALWFTIGAVAIVAVQSRSVLRAHAGWLAVAGGLALALALLWPYYPIEDLASQAGGSATLWADMHHRVLQRGFLVLPGVVALALRARDSLRDPLIWMFAGGIAVYGVSFLAGQSSLGRVIPGVALAAHVALADLTADLMARRGRRIAAWALVGAIGVAGLAGSASALVRMVPRELLPDALSDDQRLEPEITPYTTLTEVLGPTDVVLASEWMRRVVPAIEGRVVLPGQLTPLLQSRPAREADHVRFFLATTTHEERAVIAARWDATLVVIEPEDLARYPWLADSYPVVAETDSYLAYSVD